MIAVMIRTGFICSCNFLSRDCFVLDIIPNFNIYCKAASNFLVMCVNLNIHILEKLKVGVILILVNDCIV